MKIIYAYADNQLDGYLCSSWLCFFPVKALRLAGYDAKAITIDEFVHGKHNADIYVVERLLWNGSEWSAKSRLPHDTAAKIERLSGLRVLDKIASLQSRGRKVVAIFDDHYAAYPRVSGTEAGYDLWHRGIVDGYEIGFNPLQDFRKGLSMVDAVFSPSKFLLSTYVPDGKPAYHIPNRPDIDLWQRPVQHPTNPVAIRIGWSATLQHAASFHDDVIGALARLRDRIVVVGIFPHAVHEKLLSHRIRTERYDPVPIHEFPGIVYSYDVGICPLSGEYDKARSWIKWLECSLARVPVVAEDNGVYDDCKGGLRVSGEQGWHDGLVEVIENAARYAAEGHSWAWRQHWNLHVEELVNIFREIIG